MRISRLRELCTGVLFLSSLSIAMAEEKPTTGGTLEVGTI